MDQQKLYFRYNELKNTIYIMDIENYDIEEDILICVTIDAPKTHLKMILRDPLEDIKISDVRFLNSNERNEPHKVDFGGNDLAKFNVDLDKLPWPNYRDWTAEAAYLCDIIVKNKGYLLSDDILFALQ